MFIRFLGYGIRHQDQTQFTGPSTEAENQADLEEDIPDLQNMARIAQDMARIAPAASNSENIAHSLNVHPLSNANNRNEAAIDNIREDDENLYDEDLDAIFEAEADGDYDLDGNL